MVSEDIGLANPTLPAVYEALYTSWLHLKKKQDSHQPERLPFVHAVMLLATSAKSRTVDNALLVHFNEHEALRREVPDYAIDKHTPRGRRANRGIEFFVESGSVLGQERCEEIDREYKERAEEMMLRLWGKAPPTPEQGDLFAQ